MNFLALASAASRPEPSAACRRALSRQGIQPTRFMLTVSIVRQRMFLFEKTKRSSHESHCADYEFRRYFIISTSRFGVGQVINSFQTPLGLHRVAAKLGGGQPPGTVFRHRRPIGWTWQGHPPGEIMHRILWLEGVEPGLNRGGLVDTFRRHIYIHGFSDETTLGRPCSRGCLHLGAHDLIPLFDKVPAGTLVWIGKS